MTARGRIETMTKHIQWYLAFLAITLAAACGSKPGPDSISSHGTYSTQVSSCTSNCHAPGSTASPDPLVTNGTGTYGKHVAHVTTRSIDCSICHLDYTSQPTHFNGTLDTGNPAITIVNIVVSGQTGSWINDTGPQTGTCANISCHGTTTLDWYGTNTWTPSSDCSTCHVGALDPVLINGSGTAGKHFVHVSGMNIPCTKCHLLYPNAPHHINGSLDTTNPAISLVQFDAANPAGSWINDTGAQTGSCASLNCHDNTTLDWYGTNTWTTPTDCSICHATALGTRRQVLGTGGDFTQQSHHAIDYTNRARQMITSPDCLICHNMDNHTSGTVRLLHKDNAGQIVTYNPSSPSTLEPFCLSCHDTNGASLEADPLSPFSGHTNTLGTGMNVAGDKISTYWSAANPTHKNSGLTCAGTGAPNTGCHGNNGAVNGHGSSTRGLLAQNMGLPIPATQAYNYNDYKLCFDCHSSYPAVTKEVVLGYSQTGHYNVEFSTPTSTITMYTFPPTPYYTSAIQSLFRDQYISGDTRTYNDFLGLPAITYTYMPLHNLHLTALYTNNLFFGALANTFSWNYRGDAAQIGRITCTSCHNVHGTTNAIRNSYDEFQLMRGVGTGADLFTEFDGPALNPDIMIQYPINCAANCHGANSPTINSYWYSPSNE